MNCKKLKCLIELRGTAEPGDSPLLQETHFTLQILFFFLVIMKILIIAALKLYTLQYIPWHVIHWKHHDIMEAKRNRQLTIWNGNTTVIQGYGSHVTRCYYEVSRFIMWLVSIVELNVLYLQQCGKWECILSIFDVTLHGFLFAVLYINNRKLTFVLSNPWWICALGIYRQKLVYEAMFCYLSIQE